MTLLSESSQVVRSQSQSALRNLRQARGLTVEDLASRAGISGRTVVSAELGEHHPYPATRRVLAMALGVSEAVLWPSELIDPEPGANGS